MAEELPQKFEFHFIKSNSFRVVHSDGVWGGTTPRGYITMSFYSERAPLPDKVTHEVMPEGLIGQEISRDNREGITREIEIEVVMDLDTAKSLIPWLQRHIQFLENQLRQRREDNQ